MNLIFIVNDSRNESKSFIERFNYQKRSAHINLRSHDTSGMPMAINNAENETLISFTSCYKDRKYLYIDGATFGDTNEKTGKEIANAVEDFVKGYFSDVTTVFIRITDYEGKNETIDNLLRKYSPRNEDVVSGAHFMNFGKTIILNKTFINSRYATFGNNIIHEVINRFRTENDERYFYLCPYGQLKENRFIKSEYNADCMPIDYVDREKLMLLDYSKLGKSEEGDTSYVLLRKVNNVKVYDPVAFDDSVDESLYENIRYNGKPLPFFYGENEYFEEDAEAVDGERETGPVNKTLITFKAPTLDDVEVPSEKIAIESASRRRLHDYFGGSSMHKFVIEGSTIYEELRNILDEGWEREEAPKLSEYVRDIMPNEHAPDFVLRLIGKEKRETYYSDIIAYIFSKAPSVLNAVLASQGDTKRVTRNAFSIKREEFGIDILATSYHPQNKFYAVIENKIEACFNENELKAWTDFVSNSSNLASQIQREYTSYKNANPNLVQSQLAKYYLISKYLAMKNGMNPDDNVYLIICPEAYAQSYSEIKNNYIYGDQYTVVSYRDIYDAITDEVIMSFDEDDRPLITEIKNSIGEHVSTTDNFFVKLICHRFGKKSMH